MAGPVEPDPTECLALTTTFIEFQELSMGSTCFLKAFFNHIDSEDPNGQALCRFVSRIPAEMKCPKRRSSVEIVPIYSREKVVKSLVMLLGIQTRCILNTVLWFQI